MPTSYQVPIDGFINRVEKDKSFFKYFGLTDVEAVELATKRSKNYLLEAIGLLKLKCPQSIIGERDELLEIFLEDWNDIEKFLVPSLMYQLYLDRDVAMIKTVNVNFTPTELRVFDPSNARSTFLAMYQNLCDQNDAYMDNYNDIDRKTGKLLSVDYAFYDE